MEQINNSVEVLNIVRSIVHHLNKVNLANMIQKMIALRINNVKLLEEISDIIFDRALRRQNCTHIYAHMCAAMINDSKFNKPVTNTKTTFQKVLLEKCENVFYTLTNYQQELDKFIEKMKNNNVAPNKFITSLNHFQFDFNKTSMCNCRFMGELFRKGAFPKKVILSCITQLCEQLSNEKNEIQLYCLCIILQLAGPILSKTYDLNIPINKLVTSLDNHDMSSALKCLILRVQRMHSKGWINEESVEFVENNYFDFSKLPLQMKSVYRLKSYKIMAEWIFDECYDVLFDFVNKKKTNEVIQLLEMKNTWICYDPVSFVVSLILVALEENQNIRNYAGKLLDHLNKKRLLSNRLIKLGVNKVLNDSGIKKEYPNLSNLIFDITAHCSV
ncbi:eukaryotic translation initiation factor 4 gamma 1-like [Myzus persicae]|uniref:eukaryotic translation initiation factor 4 gamma 1-like n=1 Tax=Myzus persicae TaxID=13164 RepID=UPI000B937A08|nr:eukaryotic translation initiation factor 4 gamma 1-like [Myzus persicae]XP_022176871.1 eukaryotic translation initiation factor 4 gamma 1-like [Myzus persicae]XP_022176872.1 eukaryotic translation initiation factor 4 gamma 1-like [Myzus persicae]XP_022176873.1 eukaryotic translation initiation factor 4 gamma 1-like [Myzus persicae]